MMFSEIKYYPVIDCDPDGSVKVPMTPVPDEAMVRRSHTLWLQEIVPHSFRLCSTEEGLKRLNGKYAINCPLCGKELRMIADGTERHRHGLYVCSSCKR